MNGGPPDSGPAFEDELPAEALARLRAALRLRTDARRAPSDPAPPAEAPEIAPPPSAAPIEGRDPLPEYAAYRDTGCHVSPSCLRCPLAVCIFDAPPQPRRQARRHRDRRLRALAALGWNTERLARRFGLSPSQVRRIRARND